MSGPGYDCSECGMHCEGLRPEDGLCGGCALIASRKNAGRGVSEPQAVPDKCQGCGDTHAPIASFYSMFLCPTCIRKMRTGAYPTGTSIPDEKEVATVASKEEREAVREALCGKTTAALMIEACDEIKAMLLKKNESYGDSALKPTRIFSRATTVQGLCTRIDDKLSRIMRGNTAIFAENDVDDLIGYLVLLRIAKKQEAETPAGDGASFSETVGGVTMRRRRPWPSSRGTFAAELEELLSLRGLSDTQLKFFLDGCVKTGVIREYHRSPGHVHVTYTTEDDCAVFPIKYALRVETKAEATPDAGPALLALRTGGLSLDDDSDEPKGWVCTKFTSCPSQRRTDDKTPTGERVYLCVTMNEKCDFCRKVEG